MPKHTIQVTKDLCGDRAIWHAPLLCDGHWILHTERVDVVTRWPALTALLQEHFGSIPAMRGVPVRMTEGWSDFISRRRIPLTFVHDGASDARYPVKIYKPARCRWGVALQYMYIDAFMPDRLALGVKGKPTNTSPVLLFHGDAKHPFAAVMPVRPRQARRGGGKWISEGWPL